MRYDSEHKQRTRQRVLAEAAAQIRSDGTQRVAVAALMAKVGLTHGGFYAHFESKDDLIAQAIAQMFDEGYEKFRKWTRDKSPVEALGAYLDNYLSARHRDQPALGCPLPVMSAELPRLDAASRTSFATGYDRLTGAIAGLLQEAGRDNPKSTASSTVAEMVGAITLARALGASAASDRLLKNTRDALRQRLAL